jgi:hypothetical protein
MTLYDASVPRYLHMLRNLAAILAKGEEHATAHKIDPAALLGARLFPDMLPLVKQVQIASDQAKGATARLAGVEVPRFEDTEQSFAELQERLAKTIVFIESLPAEGFEGAEARQINLKVGGQDLTFQGMPYLLGYALPNFYFHVVTAYDILRHNGVELHKHDYIGTL